MFVLRFINRKHLSWCLQADLVTRYAIGCIACTVCSEIPLAKARRAISVYSSLGAGIARLMKVTTVSLRGEDID